jgi:predicted nucleotidyltransferase
MKKQTDIKTRIRELVRKKFPLAKIYLYGSRAKGTNNKNSDWDLLVLLDKTEITPEIEKQITYPLYELEIETGEIISPMVYSTNEWESKYQVTSYYKNVMKEGVLL